MKWESCDNRSMHDFDRKEFKAVNVQLMRKQIVKRYGLIHLADADFDRRFPDDRNADKLFVSGIFDQTPGGRAQTRASGDKPQNSMSIEQ